MKGSYCLLLKVERDLKVKVRSGKVFEVKKGIYSYCGSAMGGLRNRLLRHFRRNKKRHWHLDFLTSSEQVKVLGAWVFVGRNVECELAKLVSKFGEPIKGFGSSDCKCESHLFLIKFLTELKREMESAKVPFLTKEGVERYGN